MKLSSSFPQLKGSRYLREIVAYAVWGYHRFALSTADADGDVLDILAQARRNAKDAKRFFSRLVKQFGQPHVVVTDKLGSYIQTTTPNADHQAH